jgi:hypothetical protein
MTKHLTFFLGAISLLTMPAVAQTPNTLTIPMHALNGSGENGEAILVQGTDGVHVTVALAHGSTLAQPTHIHIGTCGAINKAPEYGLSDTIEGKGDSVVRGVKIADLLAGHFAINVHKSGVDLGTYSSCGDIR